MRKEHFMRRRDRTNARWVKLEPLLPGSKEPGRPPVYTKRQLIIGIRRRTDSLRNRLSVNVPSLSVHAAPTRLHRLRVASLFVV
ncbi:hypothetical protein SipoB123_32690 [Streptomyces ipomoeae]|nr:hypothetical protein SipoB123_32690 [Streptomyces ipomoeae]